MIAKITRAYVRYYRDNGQTTATVEWLDHRDRWGRTESTARWQESSHRRPTVTFGQHMHALFARAKREGLKLERETW